jgi:flagellar hook-associated protein 3 FlgL
MRSEANMRITNNYIFSNAEAQISEGYTSVSTLQDQVSTGIRVNEANVDPVDMAQITSLQSNLDSIAQSQKTASYAQTQLQGISTQLNGYGQILQSVSQIVMQAANGTSNPTDLKNDAIELKNYLNQLIIISNAKDPMGNSIFAGNNTTQDAYTATKNANGDVTAVTYNGNDTPLTVNLNNNASLKVTQSGNTVFGSGASSIFSNLISFIQRLETGAPLTAQEAATESKSINDFQASNSGNIVDVGNESGMVNFELTIQNSLQENYKTTLSRLRDADYPTAVSELSKQMTILKATMAASEQVEKLSIFNQD